MVSLYTILKALSCSLFILSLVGLPLNIHTRGQYLNYNSIKALKRIHLFLNDRNLATLVKTLSFLLVFFSKILDKFFSNFRFKIVIFPDYISIQFSSFQFPHLFVFILRMTFFGINFHVIHFKSRNS